MCSSRSREWPSLKMRISPPPSNRDQFDYENEVKDKEEKYMVAKGRLENLPITIVGDKLSEL